MSFPKVGPYEPLMELASGGMGVVYIARKIGDAGFERLVVVKRVHPRLLVDPTFRTMLRDEARVLSLLHEAHIASVIDVVETEGELSLVLEYVESMSLAALLASASKRGERMPVAVAGRIVADALTGLHAAHEAVGADGAPLGLIHRDVSPQNIIVGFDGTSRLIDFGIAKATTPAPGKNDDDTTRSGMLKGKLRYMSPEQLKHVPLDRRSDVFSAGVVLYEALAGERLFRGDDEGEVLLSILLGDVRPPSERAPDVPPALDAVVQKALERAREDRYESAAQFEEALDRAAGIAPTREVARFVESHGGEALAERRARLREAVRGATARGTGVSASLAAVPPADGRWRWALLGVSVAIVAVVAVLVARRSVRADAPAPPPPSPSVAVEPAASTTAAEISAVASAASASPSVHTPPTARPHPELHRNPYGHR